jgi:serine/threonine protein kinase
VANILSCPSCAAVVVREEAGSVCPQCRTPLPPFDVDTLTPDDADLTRLAEPGVSAGDSSESSASSGGAGHGSGQRSRDSRSNVSSSTGWLSSSGAIDHGRFAPGTLLGGRYRIIERLGRGGMGEVYRADDLKLGQPVALKFLPADVDRDPARLTQLHTEVRMARQVSHPNVCRVYDIDELDGSTFLSMEYIDGEDLASSLRRIGRFPEDRALEIARQVCAGLAAAHERGVVHRDLKPANVMLDGTGKVRITDFGLAGAAGETLRAGTPAYMAPEQLAGGEVTPKSDIYALGLLLYEIFTGQRALDGKNLAELIHKREQSGILPPTSLVKSLDPKIEAAIMRCLKPQIDERPATALAVAAVLPGGDPLAAALAAGETPSPQMVAAAGSRDVLSLAATVATALWIVASLIAVVLLYQRVQIVNRVPLPKPPAALEDRAQEALVALGYPLPSRGNSASGFGVSRDYVHFIEATSTTADRWKAIQTVRPETVFFWYRTSPQPLIPWGSENQVSRANPPFTVSGMTIVLVDASGRLSEFLAIPSPSQPDATPPPADWSTVFAAAGLSMADFKPAPSRLVPPVYADERRAWEGSLAEAPEHTIRVEAAAAAGKPVYFALAGPWSRPSRLGAATPSLFTRVIGGIASLIMPGLMVLGAVLARINLKAGRGDRAGAFRVASVDFLLTTAAWALGASHFADFGLEVTRAFAAIGAALFDAAIVWLTYLGLEPYIRRYSPDSILGWTKLLAGHWRDPRVGVDVMVGVAAGLAMTIFYAAHNMIPVLAGGLEPMPLISSTATLDGIRFIFAAVAAQLSSALTSSLLATAGVVALVLMLRHPAIGFVAAVVLFTPAVITGMFPGTTPRLDLAIGVGIISIFIAVILRAGLLAAVAALFTHFILLRAPITIDLSSWHATPGLWLIGVVLTAGLGACYLARFGRGDRVSSA